MQHPSFIILLVSFQLEESSPPQALNESFPTTEVSLVTANLTSYLIIYTDKPFSDRLILGKEDGTTAVTVFK